MLYLGTNEFGQDLQALGFPEIHSCHAIIYDTKTYLFGWHDSSATSTLLGRKATFFNQRVQQKAMNAEGKCLYGVINSTNRFDKESDDRWGAELLAVANALNFRGSIKGYRVTSHIASKASLEERKQTDNTIWAMSDDKIYVEAKRTSLGLRVQYKTWSKLDYGGDVPEPDNNRKQMFGSSYGEVGTKDKTYDHKAVVGREGFSGKLHSVWKFQSFR